MASEDAAATIHDVARLAKVSPSTVSNVLNGRLDRMRPATRERVREAIRLLGYAPNQLARELKTGIVPIIGLIVPSVANPFWGAFARQVETAAMVHNYQVLLCNSERDLEREKRYAESLLTRGIRGVIFGSAPLSFDHLAGLIERGLQAVAFDRYASSEQQAVFDSVRVNNVHGMELAVNHLLELNHSRIGFISGPLRSVNRLDRLRGYRLALATAGIQADERLIWQRDLPQVVGDGEGLEIGRTAVRELMVQPNPPTALVAINDMTAFGVYSGLRELGLRVSEQVSVVGFDDITLTTVVDPPLTTVRQPLREMLRTAVDLLIGRLEEIRFDPPLQLMVEPQLVVRASTRRIATEGMVNFGF
jgi:DNA-binding LacI/PurR family transcriptional regulator